MKISLLTKNSPKLSLLLQNIQTKNQVKARFVPNENFESNLIKSYNSLLEKQGNVGMLGLTFKKDMLDQLSEFYAQILPEFQEITKDNNIGYLKILFTKNVKLLVKEPKIPDDDDLKILSGYCSFQCSGSKCLISEDEHFWGYAELIESSFGIRVVKEWECHFLIK